MSGFRRILVALVSLGAVVLAAPSAGALTLELGRSAEEPNPGIAALNELRALSGLAPVSEDDGMTSGARRHSEYMIRTGTMTHSEDPSSPWYSPRGTSLPGSRTSRSSAARRSRRGTRSNC